MAGSKYKFINDSNGGLEVRQISEKQDRPMARVAFLTDAEQITQALNRNEIFGELVAAIIHLNGQTACAELLAKAKAL